MPKKTGEKRFCVDYRKLNAITKRDVFPIPDIQCSLDALSGSRFFSLLDLRSGYYQIALDPKDAEKTAFITMDGLWQFKVMPFGLCNAPATFSRMMTMVLGGLLFNTCLVYIDDLIVFSKTFDEHLLKIEKVLTRLTQAGLTLKPSKCEWLKTKILYLGHVITAEGQEPDPSKIESVKNFQTPQNIRDVKSFVALCSYYRKFIPKFADIAKPLTELTKKTSHLFGVWHKKELLIN